MFFIFCYTIAVNLNLGDQANLAALLRSLVWGSKRKKNAQSWRPAACSRLTEVLLLPLQRPLSEACSLLIIQFAGRSTALGLLCPQPSVIAYHFDIPPCLALSIPSADLTIFSWASQPPPLPLIRLLGKSPAFEHRDPNAGIVRERRKPVGPVCLTST